MKKVVTALSIKEDLWEHSDWYRALTLSERLASLYTQPVALSSVCSAHEIAQRLLKCWKEQCPFDKGNYFERRLALDSLTEEEFEMLLAVPPEVLREHTLPPSWLVILREAFSDERVHEFVLPQDGGQFKEFLLPLKPLLKVYIERLQAGLRELAQTYSSLPFDPAEMVSLLFTHIPERLFHQLMRVLVLELNVARVQGRLQGETPEERFHYFLWLISQPHEMLALLEEYALLSRILVEKLEQWVCYELEFCQRLCADWVKICTVFPQAREAGSLLEIQANRGDLHRGGKSVCILVWHSGFRLVYKPRSLAVDLHFQEMLAWLNSHNFQPEFRLLHIIDKGNYGWSEWVEAKPSSSHAEVTRFYQRQGGYLAVLFALEAMDIHSENIIAAGEHPALIDLEALFQPRREESDQYQGNIATQAMYYSVLRVGLVPRRTWSNEQVTGIDQSGMGGRNKQRSPLPVSMWIDAGTDQMRWGQDYAELTLGAHRPTLNGQDVDTLEFREDIVAGFVQACRLLIQHRDELLQNVLPRFANDEVRYLVRNTHTYAKTLADSYHPDALRDALERDRLLDRLWIGVEQRPLIEEVLAAERADLLVGDIPMFTTTPSSHDLFTSRGERFPAFFHTSALDMVRRRLHHFSEQDLEKQVWIIRASFTSMELASDAVAKKSLQLQPVCTLAASEHFLSAAKAVGERLEQLAFHNEESGGWLGVNLVFGREWHLLPAGVDLYSGLSGIILFMAYLGVLTGEERYIALARKALTTLQFQIDDQKTQGNIGLIGAFNGNGSYIYLLSHLGTLWNDVTLYQKAEEIVHLLPDCIDQDEVFDIVAGAAGCIAALRSLYVVAPSEAILSAARHCGDHLIAHARQMETGLGWGKEGGTPPLAGFSHGGAGIAWSLLHLFKMTGEERFRHTALAALAYERSLFSQEQRNWRDLRAASAQSEEFMTAWCHGAPGITLARLGMLSFMDDMTIREEIEVGLQTTLAQGFQANHSLCHGALGNLEPLLIAARTQYPQYQEDLARLASMLLDSIERQGWITGIPHGVETPGLMLGLAGIGYGLLRLASPDRVPSVLLLAPPALHPGSSTL